MGETEEEMVRKAYYPCGCWQFSFNFDAL